MSCKYRKIYYEFMCGDCVDGRCDNKYIPHYMNWATIDQLIRFSEFMNFDINDGYIKGVNVNDR